MLTDTGRRFLRVLLPAVALAIIVAGLWPQPSNAPTQDERVATLASNIRCPFCGGESIADAPSQIARDLEAIIAEQVADGSTDDEVYDYFEARYGEAALMAPPLVGWGWVLWAAPMVGLIAGGYAIARRRRKPTLVAIDGPPHLEQRRIADQLAQIERDLRELGDQVAAGELDDATSFDLAAAYEAEALPLRARLALLERGVPATDPRGAGEAGGDPGPHNDRRRSFVGASVFLVGVAVVSFTVVRLADDGPQSIDVPTAPPIDLSNVTLEELENVVARNPDVIGMRLALAELYMGEGDVRQAAFHYGEVLQRERNPEALAWLGFISFQVGEQDAARSYLEEALETRPEYAQAQWWLANVLFYGFERPDEAVPYLEALLTATDLTDDLRAEVEAMLDEAGGTG